MHPQRNWEYYKREFEENRRSYWDIANDWGVPANTIRREVLSLGFKSRTKSEAQANALKVGRSKHPTEGKPRTEEVKLKISEEMSNAWKNISEAERIRRSNLAKQQWEDMSVEDRENLHSLAMVGLKKSAAHGSALEKYLYENLLVLYPAIQYHCKYVVSGTKLHLDLVLPDNKIAIEIDGPSHSKPVWGQATLEKVQKTDEYKNNILTSYGFIVLRLQHLTKNLSASQKRKYLTVLKEKIEEIQSDRTKFVGKVIYLNIGED